MKLVAIVAALILHTTGFWAGTSAITKAHLSDRVFGRAVSAPAVTTPTTVPSLPVAVAHNPLSLTASHALAVDADTMAVLYGKDPDVRVPIASITKLVTVLVITERHGLNQRVTIPQLPDYDAADETLGLVPGDSFTVGELIKACLISSDNDAADALAIWDAGSAAKFELEMNRAVARWGITDTHFNSTSGLVDTDNYSSATALAKIAKLDLANPFIRATVAAQTATITSAQGHTYNLTTTNTLLENNTLYGIKTGYTQSAGECLVGITTIDGHPVITVILGADDRFADTSALITWIGQNWQWL